jgi:hypothetical protein
VFGVVIGLLIRSSPTLRRAAWTPDHRRLSGRWDDTGGAGLRPYRGR